MLLRRPEAITAAVAVVLSLPLATATGCVGVACPAVAHLGEVRIEAPPAAFGEITAITGWTCPDACDVPQTFALSRMDEDTFVADECDEPDACPEYRVEEATRLVLAAAGTQSLRELTYELDVTYADGATHRDAGDARIASRMAGTAPCRQEVADAVIDLA